MKTIGKKLKAIYVMAVIALVSICMSFIPLMTNTVKANEDPAPTSGLRITGAQVKTIDEAYKTESDPNDEFALYFHAEIDKDWYDTTFAGATEVQFGMLVGPASKVGTSNFDGAVADFDLAKGAVVESREVELGKAANFRFVGTGLEEVVFTDGVMSFEAGVVFNVDALLAGGGSAAGLNADQVALLAAATELTAVPYYVADGNVTMNALDSVARTAKDVLLETSIRIDNECSDGEMTAETIAPLVTKYVGAYELVENEYYYGKENGKIYGANENNELVVLDPATIEAAHVAVAGVPATTSYSEELANLAEGDVFAIACTQADGGIGVLPVKVITKVLSTYEDFFKDTTGDGVGDAAETNYIFALERDGRSIISKIEGTYVLANNIDCKNSTIMNAVPGEVGAYVSGDYNMGNRMTFDGRGFAMKNINAFSRDGLFGVLNSATIKNVAFDGIYSTRNDGTAIFTYFTYGSTIENVYIRVPAVSGGGSYTGATMFGTLKETVVSGESTFRNVIVENTAATTEGNTARAVIKARFGNDTVSTYENVAIVGAATNYGYAAHSTDTTKYVYTLHLPASVIAAYGVEAKTYALAELPEAVLNAYSSLINNFDKSYSYTTGYLAFAVDASGRDYYLNNDALSASAASSVYAETGCWIKLGDELVWKSLVDESKLSVKTDSGNTSFKDSIEVDMYYGESAIGAEIALSGAGAEFVEVSGNTISRKAGRNFFTNKTLTATLTFGEYTKTIDLTLLFDIDKVVPYESGEFVIDRHTGKVLKANANNELVTYDATSYIGEATAITVGDVAQTVTGTTVFTLDKAGFETLTDGSEYLIVAGENVLKAKVVTKVLSTLKDFFNDADASGAVEDAEMTRANYIFNLMPLSASGAANPRIAIKGYYVLANNIDLQSNGNLCNRSMNADGTNGSGDHTVQIFNGSQDVGFRGTLDGRGFALKNINAYGSSAGMFGAFYGATVKNIAFDGATNSAGNGSGLVIGYVYNSTFENVYIRLIANTGGDGYSGADNSWRAMVVNNTHGGSTIKNLVVESVDGLAAGKTNHHARFTFGDNPGTYENTAIIGMPTTFSAAAHATDTSKYVLTLKISAEAMTALGVNAGETQLSALPTAVTDFYANLIANLESRRSIDIDYINFVADVEGRAYYLDSAALGASAASSVYAETGCWVKLGDELIWKSLADTTKLTVSASSTTLTDSVTVDMLYNGANLGAELSVSDADAKYVSISGNTVSRTNERVFTDKVITITAKYEGIAKTVDLTLPYNAGEFVIDITSGKVYEVNTDNELVVYDATSYLEDATSVTIGGAAKTVANVNEFTLEGVDTLTFGNQYEIIAGENVLKAKAVTKVLSTVKDFFVDANADGTVAEDEMVQANYIFKLESTVSYGVNLPSTNVKGLYVLANNIDLQGNTQLTAIVGGSIMQIWNSSNDVGFRGTLDGRGFALQNGDTSASPSGMFGSFYGATIKNIAFVDFTTSLNKACVLLGSVYGGNKVLDNVYIKVKDDATTTVSAVATRNNHGTASYGNVVFENPVTTGKFDDNSVGGATNVAIVGYPTEGDAKYTFYTDNAALVADTEVANVYVATGFWKIVENALVWASL